MTFDRLWDDLAPVGRDGQRRVPPLRLDTGR